MDVKINKILSVPGREVGGGTLMKNQDLQTTFADSLNDLINRAPSSFSFPDIAKGCGISEASLRKYKDGEHMPSVEALVAIANFFQVPVDVLLGRADIEDEFSYYSRQFLDYAEDCYEKYLGTSKTGNRVMNCDKEITPVWPYNLLDSIQKLGPRIEQFEGEIPYPITDDQKVGLDYAIFTLTEREQDCVFRYFKEDMTLAEIGEMQSIGRERIRQIIAKAVRKLRHPSRFNYVRYGRKAIIDRLRNQDLEKELRIKTSQLEGAITKIEAKLELAKEIIDNNNLLDTAEEDGPAKDVFSMSLVEMDLNVRPYNCLARAGCTDVADVISKIEDGTIIEVRNMGRKSCQEIASRLIELGYASKKTKALAMTG